MPTFRWTRWIALGALVIAAGCTASDGGNAAPSTTERAPATDTAADTRLVNLFLYQVDDGAEYELIEATIARCMERAGFPYDPNAYEPSLVRRTGDAVLPAERKTRGFGYASAGEPPVPVPDPENSNLMNEYGAPWSEALGPCEEESSGVLPERQEKLNKELAGGDRRFIDAQSGAYAATVIDNQPEWSECMDRAGLAFATQEEMHKALQAAAAEDGALDREIEAAVADDRCAAQLWASERKAMIERIVERVGGTQRFGDPYDPAWSGD